MKPVQFKQANRLFTRPPNMADKECDPLPVFADGEYLVSCWQASFRERLKFLFRGTIWFWIFGNLQPPICLDLSDPWKGGRP